MFWHRIRWHASEIIEALLFCQLTLKSNKSERELQLKSRLEPNIYRSLKRFVLENFYQLTDASFIQASELDLPIYM